MDKSWMVLPRQTEEYRNGVESFLQFAFSNANINGMILCPCVRCKIGIFVSRAVAYDHLTVDGFIKGYTHWVAHGEIAYSASTNSDFVQPRKDADDMQGLVYEAFGIPEHNDSIISTSTFENDKEIPTRETEKFYKLIDDSQKELYPGKMTNRIFDMLLNLLRETFPNAMDDLPKSYYEAEKLMKQLGLGYEKFDTCPNDCTLFWRLDKDRIQCKICSELRWETSENDSIGEKRKITRKVLWYFPIKPRLQRLFMSSKTASHMRWHSESRTKDGYMRHPADSPSWQTFDHKHPEFAKDPRNIRLGLASDGFNPFKNMSVTHSTWPVILMPYNLPPWMCMKQPYFMLSLLIPGPSAPGNNIDIYLQHLIADLKDLWEIGVQTYDASTKQNFQLHASLLWTISDFPGHANLSGWSTKGKLACPVCHQFTHSQWLKHGGKYCYMGHRRFLNSDHVFRKNAQFFDGTEEHGRPPPILSGDMVINELKILKFTFGKTVNDNSALPFNWKKMSIFFDLPYWKDNVIRHNLDFMHIEKNVCESICGTLLNIEGKSKDNLKSRLGLQEMGIRSSLHPIEKGSNKVYLPPASFSMGKKEKDIFCKIFPPSFFDIMVHLTIHLATEVQLAGPVHYRWMYPIERYLGTLKSYVRNRSRPEGSIAEGLRRDKI
ncbi:uncharacterized protein LOC122043134 [Zingiber officinale]|uniref:uncharacterized protein LOC122043134 n=1 Tax=Zingiber officinale TaxID=94328 RepID=UPI001C4BF941|nr:uncharacterized protein LOC122043134 [Zingiber officinale]